MRWIKVKLWTDRTTDGETTPRELNIQASKEVHQLTNMIWASGEFDGAMLEVLIKPADCDEYIPHTQIYYKPFFSPLNAVGKMYMRFRLTNAGAGTSISVGIQ